MRALHNAHHEVRLGAQMLDRYNGNDFMGKSLFAIVILAAILGWPHVFGVEPSTFLTPAFADEYVANPSEYPVRVSIPSIGLNSPVQTVGLNATGEIDVPDGSTNIVGWYQYGAIPGDIGNAIMDAHVYAAFKNLRHAKIGDVIVVKNATGEEKQFVITDSRVYALSDVPMENIVRAEAGRRLVLITCARKFSLKLGTYTHRLVVYAQLAE